MQFKKIVHYLDKYLANLGKRSIICELVYGSALDELCPNDIDICVLHKNLKYRKHEAKFIDKVIIDVDMVPASILDEYITDFFLWSFNWELEVSRYIYGRVIYGSKEKLYNAIKRIKSYPDNIRQYLFLHRFGECYCFMRRLLAQHRYGRLYKEFDIRHHQLNENIISMILPIEKIIPKEINYLAYIPVCYKKMLREYSPVVTKSNMESILRYLAQKAITKIPNLLSDTLYNEKIKKIYSHDFIGSEILERIKNNSKNIF